MGTVISKAANGIGATLAATFVAPIKTIFGASCEGVCSGTWDLTCFIEHLCVSNLVKLLMVLGLCYIRRSLCKMSWAACKTYWYALGDISCFLWYKLKNTKRIYRRRRHFPDVEEGYSSSEEDSQSLENYGRLRVYKERRSVRERRKDRMRRSLHPLRHRSKGRYRSCSGRHHVRWKTSEVSVRVKDLGRGQNSRRLLRRRNAAHVRVYRRRRG
ncbi:uncharacterized protein LOC131242897 isoform X2 [Magnolia sinica]|uniref:uncharacterized protein LOC131242897 isoform X2 n=1 Tax=Magnolia sinica TaxID=86752 RepID=UPI0026589A46|nr:uncharacterized protein LOC131242897 isoform X2 [Magnolia sinica]